MASEDNDFGAFVIGFMIGGLVGAATALLLAPQSGEETRTIILDKSTEVKTKASESATKAMQDARVRAEDFAATAKERAQSVQKKGSDKAVVIEDVAHVVEVGGPATGAFENGHRFVHMDRTRVRLHRDASCL